MATKDEQLKSEFIEYLQANPELRFWQALRNWSNAKFIYANVKDDIIEDTFYWEDKK